jgi:hypothetical protein
VPDVSPKQLIWNQFRKQNLFSPRKMDFYQIAADHLGLHSTDYWTPYFSVWARIGDYDADQIFKSINTGNELVRIHAFRTTVHLIHQDNFSLIQNATGPSLYRAVRKDRELRKLSDEAIEKMLEATRSAFAREPMTKRDIKAAVPEHSKYMRSLVLLLQAEGHLIRATAKHAKSNLTTYATVANWLPDFKLKEIDEEDAIREVIQRHINLNGPVTLEDIAWWLRQTKTTVKDSIAQLGDSITELNAGDTVQYMGAADYETAHSIEEPSGPLVWFLPYEDHFLKAFKSRDPYIAENIQPKLSPPSPKHYWPSSPDAPRKMPSRGLRVTGEIRPSIWLNGQVIGRWELDKSPEGMNVVTSIYKKTTKSVSEQVEEVRQNLENFVNDTLLPISGGKK